MKVFVGSSSESCKFAREVANSLLDLDCEVVAWFEKGTFPATQSTFEVLEDMDVNAAILVFSKDNKIETKNGDAPKYIVRDNVILEFGFFTGKLGRENVAYIKEENDIHIPTDLNGITYIKWRKYTLTEDINDMWIKNIMPKKSNQNTVSTGYNNIPINSNNANTNHSNISVNTVAQTNYNSVQPTNSNKSNGGVQFTFYGVSDYASSITEFFVKIVEMIMKKYPDRINVILKNNPMISTTTANLKYSKNGNVYRKIVVNGITYYIGTSTDTNTKKSQLRNIFRSIGIEPTMDVITMNGKAL